MNRIVILVLLIFLSCDKDFTAPTPENLIEQELMEAILFDIHLLKASRSKSYKILKDNNVEPDLYIYNKYKIDSTTLRQNIAYYATASFKKSKEIENNVKKRFVAAKEEVAKEIAKRDSLTKVKAKGGKQEKKKKAIGLAVASKNIELTSGLLQSANYKKWRAVHASIVAQETISSTVETAQVIKLIPSKKNTQHLVEIPTQPLNGQYEFSIEAKKSEMEFIRLRIGLKGNDYLFNLNKGVVTGVKNGVVASITAKKNGWYKCVIRCTVKDVHVVRVNVFPNKSASNYSGNAINGVMLKNPSLKAFHQ